eukprot:m.469863 g.469863  ORF g.469863 m.469863 type:complete len:699 (+) comp29179_c0_seq1:187-2283(+)
MVPPTGSIRQVRWAALVCGYVQLTAAHSEPHAAPPTWEIVHGNNIGGGTMRPNSSRFPVYFQGLTPSMEGCQAVCGGNTTCRSFSWASGDRPSTATPHKRSVESGGQNKMLQTKPTTNTGEAVGECEYTHGCYIRVDSTWDPVDRSTSKCIWESGRKTGPQPPPPPSPNPPPPGPRPASRFKNVLVVLVDDLRPQLGCYGHNDTVRTPHLDQLAATGSLFRHAYVQIAVCSPSRTSFLTGLRPHQQNVLNFVTDFRRATPNGTAIVTLPQLFKAQGFIATGMGKTFHPKLPPNYDEPMSWSPDFPYVTAPAESSGCPNHTSPWCSAAPGTPPEMYADGVLVTEAIRQLGVISQTHRASPPPNPRDKNANPLSQPFAMFVGLHRPHMDWVVPPEFLALQPPPENISLAAHPTFPPSGTSWAFYNCTELTGRARLEAVGAHIEPETPLATTLAQNIRREYFAAVEFLDSQVGRLLETLATLGLEDSTAVALWGDHGWKLGELGQWCKETVFENDARVPLLVRAPWIAPSIGASIQQVVEMVDLYPTLTTLAGVSPTSLPAALTGQSLVPLLEGGERYPNASAFSVYPRWQQYDTHAHCTQPYSEIQAVGLSVRTADFRMTDWVRWDPIKGRPNMTAVLATELYDHRNDTGFGSEVFDAFEVASLAQDPEFASTVAILRQSIRGQFMDWPDWGPGPTSSLT